MMTSPLTILVVDDNRSSADALARILKKRGDDVQAVYGGQAAIDRIQKQRFDVVLTDLKMEPVDGMAVLDAARNHDPPIETIVFTAYGAVDVAVRAMHLGARDFLTKPVTVEQVSSRLDGLRAHDVDLTEEVGNEIGADFVAHSASAKALVETLERAVGVPSPVWIEGELGTGRTHCARTLHELGDAQHGSETPFVLHTAVEGEPWPEAGTVVLPHVDDLDDSRQRDLYRLLQTVPEGVRIVATASSDGRRLVAEGALRAELYYQLAVVVVQVPPLRERNEDIVPLFRRAMTAFARRYDREPPHLGAGNEAKLTRHRWPGNTRELLNLAERTVVLGEAGFNLEVVEDTEPGMPQLEPGFSLSRYLESVERRLLVEALRRAAGDRTHAGRLLGVERNTLRYKLNKYGLLDK